MEGAVTIPQPLPPLYQHQQPLLSPRWQPQPQLQPYQHQQPLLSPLGQPQPQLQPYARSITSMSRGSRQAARSLARWYGMEVWCPSYPLERNRCDQVVAAGSGAS
jgi:hypothetical protein